MTPPPLVLYDLTEGKPRLACPLIHAGDLAGPVRNFDLSQLQTVAEHYLSGSSTFGLELKVADLLEGGSKAFEGPSRIERSFYRLAQEPIIWSYWSALTNDHLHRDEMRELASMLNGARVEYRSHDIFASTDAGEPAVYYESLNGCRTWADDLARVDGGAGDPLKKALYRFARIISAHPFTDANGRFARSILQAGLARGGLVKTPCLALGPIIHARTSESHAALTELCISGDWSKYFEIMARILNFAVDHVRAVADLERGDVK